MRTPIFRVTNDDDPGDYAFPRAVSWPDLVATGDTQTIDAVFVASRPRCTCTLGGSDFFDPSTDPREDCAVHGKE